MNPSPYLLRFSGLASQKWTCPSTTKYFSPSFSYKALSSFSCTRHAPSSSRTYRPIVCYPVSRKTPLEDEGNGPAGLDQRSCGSLVLPPSPLRSRSRKLPALRGADDKRPRIAGQARPLFRDPLNKVSRSRWVRV